MCRTNNNQGQKAVEKRRGSFLRGCLIGCLSLLLCSAQASQAKQSVQQQLAKMPVGASVKVHGVDGKVTQGMLTSQSESGFELQSPTGGDVTTFTFGEVKSVGQVKRKHRSKGKWIAIGVAVAVGVALAVGLGGFKGDIAGR